MKKEILYISEVISSYFNYDYVTLIIKNNISLKINKKTSFSFYSNDDFIICKKYKYIVKNTDNTIIYMKKEDIIIENNKSTIRDIKLNNLLSD